MRPLFSILAWLGVFLSLLTHILSFFGLESSFLLVLILIPGVFLLFIPGIFILSPSLPPYVRGNPRAMYNMWRPVPTKYRITLTVVGVYAILNLVLAILMLNPSKPDLILAARFLSIFETVFYLYYGVLYWYHSPDSEKESWSNSFRFKKDKRLHHKKKALEKNS
jgi:hypothetical protein